MEMARKLVANAPLAVRAIKELAIRGQYMHLHDGLRLEQSISTLLISLSEDAREGPRAFAERRPADYRGR
jgi:enoyl-CoA hydratase/carnithine racemase